MNEKEIDKLADKIADRLIDRVIKQVLHKGSFDELVKLRDKVTYFIGRARKQKDKQKKALNKLEK